MTADAVAAKNSLGDGGLWLFLLKLYSPQLDKTVRITNAGADVTWNGDLYQDFPFKIEEIKDTVKGELSKVVLRVSNVDRIMQGYIESDPDFGSGWDIKIDIVYINAIPDGPIATTNPAEISLSLKSAGVSCDNVWATFSLGMDNPILYQFPNRKLSPTHCQATFKVPETGCNYAGTDTSCEYTLSDCKSKFGNAEIPFVGFPGIPTGAGVFKI